MESIFGLIDPSFDRIVPPSTFNKELEYESAYIDMHHFKMRSDTDLAHAANNFLRYDTLCEFIKAGERVSSIPEADIILYPLKYYTDVHLLQKSRILDLCNTCNEYSGEYHLNQMDCCIGLKDLSNSIQHYFSTDEHSMRFLVKVIKPENVFVVDLLNHA